MAIYISYIDMYQAYFTNQCWEKSHPCTVGYKGKIVLGIFKILSLII